MINRRFPVFACLFLTACSCRPPQPVFLPAAMLGKVDVVTYCQAHGDAGCDSEILQQAIKPPGQGGISSGVLVRLLEEVPVYRLWNGPEAPLNDYGGTNRIGAWWSADKPAGKVFDYRRQNAICQEWNTLAWAVKCTLKPGTLVAVGPTQSANCRTGDHFAANPTLQLYVDNLAARFVSCPKVAADKAARDFPVNPDEVLLEKTATPSADGVPVQEAP